MTHRHRAGIAPVATEAAITGLLLTAGWSVVYLAGGTRTFAPHLFYVPVVYAGLRLGWRGSLVTAVLAGLLCGPAMPLDVATGEPQELLNWLARLAVFVAVALVVAQLVRRERAWFAQEFRLAEAERDLAQQRAAMLQLMAHELRTPLTVLKGNVALLTRGGLPDGDAARLLAAAGRATDRLEGLAAVVQAATGAARPVEVSTHEVSLSSLLHDIINGLPRRHDHERIVASPEMADGRVRTAPHHLRVVLGCLLDNALRFSPPASPVEVSARYGLDSVRITIRDHGPGIGPDDVEHLFGAFRQADTSERRSHEGLGLGLYTARRVVEQLGGNVELLPAAGGGTAAVVTLPTGSPAPDVRRPPLAAAPTTVRPHPEVSNTGP